MDSTELSRLSHAAADPSRWLTPRKPPSEAQPPELPPRSEERIRALVALAPPETRWDALQFAEAIAAGDKSPRCKLLNLLPKSAQTEAAGHITKLLRFAFQNTARRAPAPKGGQA